MCTKCRWDGNLDGRLMRCPEHALAYKNERKARKEADRLFARLMKEST